VNKVSFVLITAATLLSARVNPFFMEHGSGELSITSNHLKAYPPLKNASVTLPSSARILKQVTVKFINIDGSVGTKSIMLSNKIDWHVPIFISQAFPASVKSASSEPAKQPVSDIKFHKFLTLKIFNSSASFLTKDKNIRYFKMISPYRVVLDFKRVDNFLSFDKQLKNSIFKNVSIGNHNGYYRVVLQLDGDYHCSFTRAKQGYKLACF